MSGTGTKKMLNMFILDILREYSDSEHRLLQQDIIDLLKSNYGMDCERRAVKIFYWAMHYGLNIEVLEPESMRECIQSACREIEKKYC
ncbi:hypothetical protein [Pseudobutyrivibrio sp.]